jgi:hypothetical protein
MALTVSTPNSGTTTVTIPAHAIGDLIILFAYNAGSTVSPAKPPASGTVPSWVDIDANSGANTNASRCVYFVATATNHTSGTWATGIQIFAVVLTGQAASPIGGHAESGTTGSNAVTAPAVTMTKTDGTSVLLHFFGQRNVTSWSAAPSGYFQKLASGLIALDTKDVTTSDGSVVQTGVTSGGNRGQTVEVLAAAGSTTTLTPSGASVAITGTAPKLDAALTTSADTVTVTGTAPSLVTQSVLTPAAASATVTGTAPKLDLIVSPPGGSLTGALITVTGSSPTLSTTLVTTGATITVTGGTPSSAGASVLTPAAATITVTGSGPKLSVNIVPPSTTLPVTGTAPTLVTVSVLSPTPAAIVISGATPNVINPITLTPAKATITVTGGTATLTVALYTPPMATPKHTVIVRREQRVLLVSGSRTHTIRRASRFTQA